ncbi:hypothetical protein WMF18_03000 [Sorangium sp. So ce315]|uniref:hypothetical protein n=1 Tax=Sorangium sp. So ce315 TaxID=3133299 RepID=UPI003F630506
MRPKELLDVVPEDDLAQPARETDTAVEAECPRVIDEERRIRARRFAHAFDERAPRVRLRKAVCQQQLMRLVERQRLSVRPARERECQGEEIGAGEQPAVGTRGEQPSHVIHGDGRDRRRGDLHASAACIPLAR